MWRIRVAEYIDTINPNLFTISSLTTSKLGQDRRRKVMCHALIGQARLVGEKNKRDKNENLDL